MKRFYLHLASPVGIERDDTGLLFEDVEHAYLACCEAIPDCASEILRARCDPMTYRFEIEDAEGQRLMTVPFGELVRPQPTAAGVEKQEQRELSGSDDELRLRAAHARTARMREIVREMTGHGRVEDLAASLLVQFESALSMQQDRLHYLRKSQEDPGGGAGKDKD